MIALFWAIFVLFCWGGGASPYSSCSTGSSRNANSVEIFRNPFSAEGRKAYTNSAGQ